MRDNDIPYLSARSLQEVLRVDSLQINHRVNLDDKGYKRVERMDLSWNALSSPVSVCVKYDDRDHVAQETMIYDAFLENDVRVPRILGYGSCSDGLNVLVMEFLDGDMPDFTNVAVVDNVFRSLGESAWTWGERVRRYFSGDSRYRHQNVVLQNKFDAFISQALNKGALQKRLREISELARTMKDTVLDVGGTILCQIFDNIGSDLGVKLAECIYDMPFTIDPGDISLHNVIYKSETEFWFIDFEYSRLAPMVFMMDVLGEPWESLPMGKNAIRARLSFLDGWNKRSDHRIEWDQFDTSYRCVRVYRKCHEFSGWLTDLKLNEKNEEVHEWARSGSKQLMELVETAIHAKHN